MHRLWDIIIFFFSSGDSTTTAANDERKRGLWWLLSPAYLIFEEKADRIAAAVSCEEVIEIFNSGCAMTYDPDWFIDRVESINQKIFIEIKANEGSQFFGGDTVENTFSKEFERKRKAH